MREAKWQQAGESCVSRQTPRRSGILYTCAMIIAAEGFRGHLKVRNYKLSVPLRQGIYVPFHRNPCASSISLPTYSMECNTGNRRGKRGNLQGGEKRALVLLKDVKVVMVCHNDEKHGSLTRWLHINLPPSLFARTGIHGLLRAFTG